MFKETLRAAEDLDGTHHISIPSGVVADSDGYIDRQCPNVSCDFVFKVHKEDWESERVRAEEVFCPSCGHAAEAKSWYTHEQVEFHKSQVLAYIAGKITQAMRNDAEAWNRRQNPKSFISIHLRVDGNNQQFE